MKLKFLDWKNITKALGCYVSDNGIYKIVVNPKAEGVDISLLREYANEDRISISYEVKG